MNKKSVKIIIICAAIAAVIAACAVFGVKIKNDIKLSKLKMVVKYRF